ncbi:MAG: acyl carrier protein [Parvibaculaceae bacterium]
MDSAEQKKMILDVLVGLELVNDKQKTDLLDGRIEDLDFASMGIDSMKVIDLCVGLEERVGREVEVEELIENPTVGRLADHFTRERV